MDLNLHNFKCLELYSEAVDWEFPQGIVVDLETRNLLNAISKDSTLPLLITGETGTGKEEMAKLLKNMRGPKTPFVSVNCAHLQGDLTDSVLFGHRKGSFSGASENRVGLIELANEGVLFLDEIHHLPVTTQAKLLRTLNDGTYNRIGCSEERSSSFQVVAATNKDFDIEVEQGRILLDLRMRLIGYELHLKPLRERTCDIPAILALILKSEGELSSISWDEFQRLTKKCQSYFWQGNIRQLVQIIRLFVRQSKIGGRPMDSKGLPELQLMLHPNRPSQHSEGQKEFKEVAELMMNEAPLATIVDLIEEIAIHDRLNRKGNLKEVLTSLEISRSTLENKRKKYFLKKGWA